MLHVYSLYQEGIRNNIYAYITVNTVNNNNQLSFDTDILIEIFLHRNVPQKKTENEKKSEMYRTRGIQVNMLLFSILTWSMRSLRLFLDG